MPLTKEQQAAVSQVPGDLRLIGRRRIDNPAQQPRAEGHDEQARGRGEGKGHDRICPHRSRGGGCRGGTIVAADRGPDFRNAKAGTPLMQADQAIGVDLPLKALVWQDGSGTTWLSYNDPSLLAKRHGLGREVEATVSAMTAALAAVARASTASP